MELMVKNRKNTIREGRVPLSHDKYFLHRVYKGYFFGHLLEIKQVKQNLHYLMH